MSEYAAHPIGELIAKHVGGGTPSRQVASHWKGDTPWASVKDFPEEAGVINDTEEHISAAGLNSSASNLIPAGVPLVCTRMAVGRAAMAAVPMAINQDVKALFPKDGVSNSYLLKLLRYIRPKAEDQSVGSTVKGVRIQDYLSIEVPIADDDAQPVIAQVLDTLDTAIAQTEAIIAKLKAVKRGLLHDLLTRGIDANGELRPLQSEAPSLYKSSALGWIPKEWDVSGLAAVAPQSRSVIRTGPFGSSLKGEHWRENGTPVVTIGSLGDGEFIAAELLYVDDPTAARLVEFALIPGDLAFSRVADVGRSVVVSESERGWIMSSNFMRISCDAEKVRPHFLQALLSSSFLVRRQLRTTVNSAGRDVANSAVLLGLRFPWPKPPEQDAILKRLESFDGRMEEDLRTLNKLKAKRTGLMDDLLTGRVRVTALVE